MLLYKPIKYSCPTPRHVTGVPVSPSKTCTCHNLLLRTLMTVQLQDRWMRTCLNVTANERRNLDSCRITFAPYNSLCCRIRFRRAL